MKDEISCEFHRLLRLAQFLELAFRVGAVADGLIG
jgi:hypothetical protein